MKKANLILAGMLLILIFNESQAKEKFADRIIKSVVNDYQNFYSLNNLWKFGLGIGYAGVYANTSFDREIQNLYVDYIKSGTTDDISKVFKTFGDGWIVVPVYLTAALIGEFTNDSKFGSTIGEWGQKTSRALFVGAPPVLFFQIALGASRPEEGRGSRWRPLKDNNAVSGHSYMGAVPFLTAAKMVDQKYLKYLLYCSSTLTGLSRINDNKHYFSQVILGWWTAYLSVNSVKSKRVTLIPSNQVIGIMFSF